MQQDLTQRTQRQAQVVKALTASLPAHALLWQSEDTTPYECDGLTAYRQRPLVVALPETPAQVQAMLRCCHALAVPVVARGAGTGLSGGAMPHRMGVTLSLAKFNKIVKIDPVARTAVVQCGVRNLAISEAAAPHGLYYAPDPSSQIACTIGGNVAENAGGVHCLKYGLTLHNIVKVSGFTMAGEAVEFGSDALDAAGFDLMSIVIGSEGMLAVTTEVTVKLVPKPQLARCIMASFDDIRKAGDAVAAGAEIGRCGNSGRSPTPHLHFQVQRGATLGSPTIPADFGDVVMRSESGYDLSTRMIPKEGSLVRPVMRDEALAGALAFTPGSEFELVEEGTGRKERAKVEVDLLGRRTLTTARARLHVDPYDAALVFIDFRGDPKSLLRYLLIGMARVPFDQASLLRWKDGLPRRLLLPSWIRAAADLVSVVVPAVGGIEVAYTGDRAEGNLRIEGTAKTWSTRTILSLGEGSHRFEIVHGKRKSAMVMTKLEAVEEARA